jgi:uncharacterized integral membrane protein (TIGR00698 family)
MAMLATAVAFLINAYMPALNAGTAAVILGALAVNCGVVRPSFVTGLGYITKSLLRLAVVLLGLQLSLGDVRRLGAAGVLVVIGTVTVTFFGTQLLARMLGLSKSLGLLVATGFSICGASAVAGMQPVAGGEEDDTVVAVALVTLCGSLAIVVLPLLRVPLGLSYLDFGSWVGASVHDVGQTVATATRVGHGAIEPAIVVKLTRVLLLAPLVAGVSTAQRRSARARRFLPEPTPVDSAHRPAPVPLFLIGFVVAVLLRSSGLMPAAALHWGQQAQQILLAAALFGLGTGVSWRLLRRAGGRPLLLGLLSWVLVATVAYVGVRLAG